MPVDEPRQIRERSTLTDEIVDEVVRLTALNPAIEQGLIGEPSEAVGSRMPHGIQLNDPIMDGQRQSPGQLLRVLPARVREPGGG